MGIPDYLPQMLVGILEVASISTPERLMGWFDDDSTGFTRLIHGRINFLPRCDVMPQRELGGADTSHRKSRIMCNALARPNRELQPWLQVKEGHRTVLKILSNYPPRWQCRVRLGKS